MRKEEENVELDQELKVECNHLEPKFVHTGDHGDHQPSEIGTSSLQMSQLLHG